MDDPFKDLNNMMSAMVSAQMVQDVVHAYDNYATAAMTACIRLRGMEMTATQIAECAWDFADKMMEERRKRGIGSVRADAVPPQSSPQVGKCKFCDRDGVVELNGVFACDSVEHQLKLIPDAPEDLLRHVSDLRGSLGETKAE